MKADENYTSLTLSGSGALLIFIGNTGGPVKQDDLKEVISTYTTRRERTRRLEEDGLIDIEITYKPRKLISYVLTDKGRQVYNILSTMEAFVAPEKATADKAVFRKYAEFFLRFTLRNGIAKHTDLLKYATSYPNMLPILDALEEDGLVIQDQETTGHKSKFITLTPAGKAAAKAFEEAYQIIKN